MLLFLLVIILYNIFSKKTIVKTDKSMSFSDIIGGFSRAHIKKDCECTRVNTYSLTLFC